MPNQNTPQSPSMPLVPMSHLETLSRLSTKPGVIATLILERSNGNILQRTSIRGSTLDASASSDVDKLPAMVWNFMNAADLLVHDLDCEVGLKESLSIE
jgi:hypothetical protein